MPTDLPDDKPFLTSQDVRDVGTPDGKIVVTGAPSTGTKLMARIIDASPDLEAWHDASHGGRHYAKARGFVVMSRDHNAMMASWEARHQGRVVHPEIASRRIKAQYDDELRALWLRYERLVADPADTIEHVAWFFDVDPWPSPEEVYDGNATWGGMGSSP